jgi:hypothetical protein
MLPFLSDHLAEPGASDADSLKLSNNVRDIPALDTRSVSEFNGES